MTDQELQTLGAKAAALPNGRNELSAKPLASVTAQALVDPQGRVRVYPVFPYSARKSLFFGVKSASRPHS